MAAPSDAQLRELLELDRVAVLGCSRGPRKDADRIPNYQRDHGYDVVPVNPHAEEIFGREALGSLADVPGPVDVVDVFRPSEEVAGIVDTVDRAGRRDRELNAAGNPCRGCRGTR